MNKEIKDLIVEIDELNSHDNKTIGERFIKYNEEFGEFSAEVAKLVGITHKQYDREHLVEEMADWIQNVFSISNHITSVTDITIDEVFDKMSEKNQKWRDLIPEYTKFTGK